MALYNRGVAQREIARRLNLSRSTVRNYIRSDGVPSDRHVKAQATPIPVRTIFGNDGSKVSTMPASLQKKSANEDSLRPITVSDVVLADWRRNVRTRSSKPQYDRTRDRQNNSVGCYSKKKKISPIESGRSNHESLTLVRMSGKLGRRQPVSSNCSGKQVGHDLAKWLDDAMGSTVPRELRNFAKGVKRDAAAIIGAISLPWSNGQTEGQVNRLKTLKRQMYGRGSFDLLRLRFLTAA